MRYGTILILSFTALLTLKSCALINPYIKALKKIEKGQFDRASFQLSNVKEDSCCEALQAYAWATHFKNESSPFYQLDSAIKWAHIGDSVWSNSKTWEKRFVSRRSEDQKPFKSLILEIDSLGFFKAKKRTTEQAFISYLNNFPGSRFSDRSISIRDSLAFQDAKRENTYISYKKFIEKYPDSKQAEAAREIYELLLYETHTRDKHKLSYENFIKKFPHSPYRNEAQEKLFELYTLDYSISSFKKFIDSFPESSKVDEARLWIHHKAEDYDSISPVFAFPQKEKNSYKLLKPSENIIQLELDSIKNHFPCDPYRKPYLIYSKSKKWGLANTEGQGQIPTLFHNLEKLRNDIYVYSNESKKGLVHVSGFRITPAEYDGFRILNDTFISVILNGKEAIASNNGKVLTGFDFEEITYLQNDLLAFKNGKKWSIQKGSDFLDWPDIPKMSFSYDTVFRSDYGRLFIGGKSLYCQLKNNLDSLGESNFKIISESENYLQTFKQNRYSLLDKDNDLLAQSDSNIYSDENGFARRSDSIWICFFNSDTFEIDRFENFNNYYKKLFKGDTMYIYTERARFSTFNYDLINTQVYKLHKSDTFCFIVGNDNKFGLINAIGDTILNLEWDEVKVMDANSIRVKKDGKYGLFNFSGKEILKPDFTAISNYNNGTLTLFKNNKFGLINPFKAIYIKCNYPSSLKLLDLKKPFFTLKSDKHLILYEYPNKKITTASDFVPINDSLIFLNENFTWNLMKLNNKGELEELGISALRYQIWKDGLDNNHIIYKTVTGYGFYDIIQEENIFPEYFMIYPITNNLGQVYLFYTFKYYEEIDLFLVKILDRSGNEIAKSLITKEQASQLGCTDLIDEE